MLLFFLFTSLIGYTFWQKNVLVFFCSFSRIKRHSRKPFPVAVNRNWTDVSSINAFCPPKLFSANSKRSDLNRSLCADNAASPSWTTTCRPNHYNMSLYFIQKKGDNHVAIPPTSTRICIVSSGFPALSLVSYCLLRLLYHFFFTCSTSFCSWVSAVLSTQSLPGSMFYP